MMRCRFVFVAVAGVAIVFTGISCDRGGNPTTPIRDAPPRYRVTVYNLKLVGAVDASGDLVGVSTTYGLPVETDPAIVPDLSVDDCKELSEWGSIRAIYLPQADITDEAVIHLARLPKLQLSVLSNNPIGDAGATSLARINTLRALNLSGTMVTDNAISELQRLPHLSELWLCNTRVTEASFNELAQFPSLTHLAVDADILTNKAMNELQKSRLQMLLVFSSNPRTRVNLSAPDGIEVEEIDRPDGFSPLWDGLPIGYVGPEAEMVYDFDVLGDSWPLYLLRAPRKARRR